MYALDQRYLMTEPQSEQSAVPSAAKANNHANDNRSSALRGAFLYFALIAWMVVIFLFSAQPNSASVTRGYFHEFNFVARKLAHFSEYAFLSVLAILSFSSHIPATQSASSPDRRVAFNAAVAMSVFYSVTDEIHQAFVPGRGAAIADVLVDSAGVFFGALVISNLRRRWQRNGS